MTTSNFATAGKHRRAVAISRGVPVWFRGRRYEALAPTWAMIRMKDEREFTRIYTERVLARLDPHRVVEELGHRAILLCWEPAGQPCHRRVAAEWLQRATGLRILEYRPRRAR